MVAAAASAGVGIDGVSPYRISHPGPGGLIFGYATVSERAIAEGVDILAHVIGGMAGAPLVQPEFLVGYGGEPVRGGPAEHVQAEQVGGGRLDGARLTR